MRQTRINDPFHNPFHNRFKVPVHSRLDEMQAYKHVIWLKDPAPLNHETESDQNGRPLLRAVAGAFALLPPAYRALIVFENGRVASGGGW